MTKVYKKFSDDDSLRYYGFYALFILIVANAVLYLFFINFGVSEILYKKEILIRLQSQKEENQILEGRYLKEMKKLNLEYAYNLGYVDAGSPLFISRTIIMARND